MRVYAVCRNCAEVHLASAVCPGCARRALVGKRRGDAAPGRAPDGWADLGPDPSPSGPRAEPTGLISQPGRSRRWWWSAAVLGAYLLAILGLLAAVVLGQATAL
ncbi:MAG TPA: hypothetical protein VK698_26995 [Kofleriaceae bacterium]|nr:hypothetical protein [Kofleriaceae bacterium]